MGLLFKRQSDKDMPRTSFNKGAQEGGLMAHEMVGVTVVIAAAMRSTAGRDAIKNLAHGDAKNVWFVNPDD